MKDKGLFNLYNALVVTVGLVLLNVVLTVNDLSPFVLMGL